MRNVIYFFLSFLYIPFCLLLFSKTIRHILDMYVNMYQIKKLYPKYLIYVFIFIKLPEIRNLIYYRFKYTRILSIIYHPLSSLYIQCPKIGDNFRIYHGFSTIINAKSIGHNFSVWQQVTIGKKDDSFDESKKPIIGNNVKVCAGAILIGNIKIGNNVIIGAGSVVVKDIPDNAVVVGNPARIIRYQNNE